MQSKLTLLFAGLCFSSMSVAANDDLAQILPKAFQTITDAQANCPDTNTISYKAGLPAPGPLSMISILTADFSGKKGKLVFSNSEKDSICSIGTKNPRAYQNTDDLMMAAKEGATPCLVMPIPLISSKHLVKDIEFAQNKAGEYGSMDNEKINCNYKYKGKVVDPDTSKSLEGFLILSSHRG